MRKIVNNLSFSAKLVYIGLYLCLATSICIAGAASKQDNSAGGDEALTPLRGSPLRKAVLDGMRQVMKRMHGVDVIFVVRYLKVKNGWAWAHVRPQSPDGSQRYEDMSALLTKKNGAWNVAEIPCAEIDNPDCLDSPDYFAGLMKRYPQVPAAILPNTNAETQSGPYSSIDSYSEKKVEGEIHPLGFYKKGEIFPLGFSKNGYFAYISQYSSPEIGGYCPKFIIANLVTDKHIIEKQYVVEGLNKRAVVTNKKIVEKQYYEWDGAKRTLINKKEISELLNQHNIDSSYQINMEKFPMEHKTSTIVASLQPGYKLILRSNTKQKTVSNLPEPLGVLEKVATGSYDIIGFFRSPFESRIAIVVQRTISGWEAQPENESFVYGAHLEKGF